MFCLRIFLLTSDQYRFRLLQPELQQFVYQPRESHPVFVGPGVEAFPRLGQQPDGRPGAGFDHEEIKAMVVGGFDNVPPIQRLMSLWLDRHDAELALKKDDDDKS